MKCGIVMRSARTRGRVMMEVLQGELIFRFDCPWCETKSVGFTSRASCEIKQGGYNDWFAECGYCKRGVVVSTPPNIRLEDAYDEYLSDNPIGEVLIAPSLAANKAPPHTPENVSRFFNQGVSNLNGRWDAAGTMFRKSLEVALSFKFPNLEGKLIHRIQRAKDTGSISVDLAEWADEIRVLGNEAAHDENPFSEEDARNLFHFTDLVLRYLFTLPEMVNEARRNRVL